MQVGKLTCNTVLTLRVVSLHYTHSANHGVNIPRNESRKDHEANHENHVNRIRFHSRGRAYFAD